MRKITILLLALLCTITATAQQDYKGKTYNYWNQLGAGMQGNFAIDNSAWMQVGKDSTSKGFLPPRIVHVTDIASPIRGLIAWVHDSSSVCVYDGTNWSKIASKPTPTLTNVLTAGNTTALSAIFTPTSSGTAIQVNGSSSGRIYFKNTSGYPVIELSPFGSPFVGDIELRSATSTLSGKVHRFAAEDGGVGGLNLHVDANLGLEKHAYVSTAYPTIPSEELIDGNKAIYNLPNGGLIESTTTSAELAYLSGVTGPVQTQIDDSMAVMRSLIGTGGSYTFNSPLSLSGSAVSITNAAADGTTMGAATFVATDFNSTSGSIALDYTNAQAADATHKGFLTSADFTNFNTAYGWGNHASAGYLTGNQTITLTGDITGTGTTSITTTIGSSKVTNAMLAGLIAGSKLVGTDIITLGTITTGTWHGSALTKTYLPSVGVYTDQANTYTTGMKQTFVGNGTNPAINITGTTSDPTYAIGDVWYNTTADRLYYADAAGVKRAVANLDQTQTFTNKTIDAGSNTVTNVPQSSVTSLTTDLAAKAAIAVGTNVQTGTSYTLVTGDNGKLVICSNASAVTLTVPSGLPTGFNCTVIQGGAGAVTFTASSTTLNLPHSYTKTNGLNTAASIIYSGTSNTYYICGDLQP